MKIGLMGGTFNPIHNGHLHIAKAALSEANLSKVIFIPTGVSYMKQGVAPSFHRFNMTKLAIEGIKDFEISDIEVTRPGYTYTKDTVSELKKSYPNDSFYYIIGTDTLFKIESWVEPEFLFSNLSFLVAERGDKEAFEKVDELKNKFNADISFLSCDFLDISSTDLREKFTNHQYDEVSDMIPEKVVNYIKDTRLYDELSIEDIKEMLKVDLRPERYLHTLGVSAMAVKLGKVYGADIKKCEIAGLLHDCAKSMSIEDMNAICNRYFIELSEEEKNHHGILHGKAGAFYAVEKYGIKDSEIIDAIFTHTTGKPDMTLLQKVIYVADYIEEGRTFSPKLNEYRERALTDLDSVLVDILKDCIEHITEKGYYLFPLTQETYDYYKDISLLTVD